MTGPQIDNRISFGNIMVAVGMIVSVAMAWANLSGRADAMRAEINANKAAISSNETRVRALDEDSGSPNAIAGVTYLDGPMGTHWVNAGDTVHWSTAANRIRGDFAGQWAYRIGRQRGWW